MTTRSRFKKEFLKRYLPEFKVEALALADKFGVPQAVKELGLHESQLCGWRTKLRAAQSQTDTQRTRAAEIARLSHSGFYA